MDGTLGDRIRRSALVFGGGGARGALQVGASRALVECDYRPDLLVGTSAGAINAAFLALHGVESQGLDELTAAWLQAAELDLLPANYVWSTLRSVLRRASLDPARRIREFFIANGLTPELRFKDLKHASLIIVSSDLDAGKPVLHGQAPEDSVLDALLASTALPPWTMPVRRHGRELMDGAVVSSLPVEAAIRGGATDVVALDLADAREPFGPAGDFGVFLNRVTYAVEKREVDLELALAQAQSIPVYYLSLISEELVHIWDFQHTQLLISCGYETTRKALENRPLGSLSTWTAPPA